MRWAWFAVLLLVAGCATPPPATEGPAVDAGMGPTSPAASVASPLRFAVADHEAVTTHEEVFTVPAFCFFGVVGCTDQERRIDLTAQVPADLPVEVAVTYQGEVCVDLWLETHRVSVHSYQRGFGEPLAASLVRFQDGTVTLVADVCSILPGDLTTTQAPVQIHVRTVGRADIVPPFLPVAVTLASGDRIEARGDLERMVVVPPRGLPVHVESPFAFNATGATGPHIVVLVGAGDLRLAGPNVTLRPLAVQVEEGPSHALASGAPATWEFSVPGVPVVVGVGVRTILGPTGQGEAMARAGGRVRLEQGGDLLLDVSTNPGPMPFPSIGLIGSGNHYWFTTYLDERFAAAPFSASVAFDVVHGYEAGHIVAWVDPSALGS